jgi:hypothetical protein
VKEAVNSKIIGELKQDDKFPDWWESKEIEVPFFDNKRLIVIFSDFEPENDNTFIDEADQALAYFLKLKTEDRNAISELVYKNCMEFLEMIEFDEADERLRQIKDKNEIWKFVYPTNIYVSRRPYNDKNIYIQIVCECEWEHEHGLQLVFRQGKKLTRISSIDGYLTEADASDIPDEKDELLSKF